MLPEWLQACSTKGHWVDEEPYLLVHKKVEVPTDNMQTHQNKVSLLAALDQRISAMDEEPLHNDKQFLLFSGCKFCLVGFEQSDHYSAEEEAVKLLGRLIRRGMGTIFWELQDNAITHVVVKDQTDVAMRYVEFWKRSYRLFKIFVRDGTTVLFLLLDCLTRRLASACISNLTHLDRESILRLASNAHVVSPGWVLESWTSSQLAQCGQFPPLFRKKPSSNKAQKSKTTATKRIPNIFRGCLFALIRVAPPDWAVDFNAQKIEKMVVAHGGQLLSLKLVEALRADQLAGRLGGGDSKKRLRPCYAICWGSFSPDNLIHPLVTQVLRHKLCELHQVTPVWLQTCVMEQKCLGPQLLPEIFVPTHRPMHRSLSEKKEKKTCDAGVAMTIRVSVTGFTGFKRSALVKLIQAMGGVYDESMRTSTTHLICRTASGDKYEKAVEWKVHAVSDDWLYHVADYGFGGQEKTAGGCEDKFSVDDSSVHPNTEQ